MFYNVCFVELRENNFKYTCMYLSLTIIYEIGVFVICYLLYKTYQQVGGDRRKIYYIIHTTKTTEFMLDYFVVW